jgi:hypothetical protein
MEAPTVTSPVVALTGRMTLSMASRMVTCGGPLPEEAQGKPAGEWNTLQQQQQQQHKLSWTPATQWKGHKRRR